MYEIDTMIDDNILVLKVELDKKSEFEMPGTEDPKGAIYRIVFCNSEKYKKEDLILLHPGTYEGLYFENVMYTVITESDIIAKLNKSTKEKK